MKNQFRLKSRHLNTGLVSLFVALTALAGLAPLHADQSPSSGDVDNENPVPVAEIAVSSEFLGRLTRLPINQFQDLVTTVDRTTLATRIASNGVANVTPWANDKPGLSFCVLANNQIHADIDATIRGPARIFVQTDAVADTTAASRKCFRLDDGGFHAWPAATNAKTKLKVLDLDVWAGGLFRQLKQRLGMRKAQQEMAKRIPENER